MNNWILLVLNWTLKMLRSNDVILVLTLCASFNWAKELTEMEVLGAMPNHCTYEYAYDMYGAHCAGLKLTKLPSLRSGIEILDFSENKLQEIHADTFSSYTSIKYLYLTENQLYYIDEDGLTSLSYLEILDLSNNVILELPKSIFQLPSLRKLNLRGNPLLHMSLKNLNLPKPIKAPLELIDISDCKIRELPDWGILPQMKLYNISHNSLTSLDVKHFAAMCNLDKVDMSNSLDDMKLCDLRPAITWFQATRIVFQLKDSEYTRLNTREFEHCRSDNNTFEIHNATYYRCKASYQQVQNIRTSRRTWLTIGGGLCGFLIGFILLLWLMHRHNVAQTKTTSEKLKQKPKDGDTHANAGLLNNTAYEQ